jgi:hypothetical protein
LPFAENKNNFLISINPGTPKMAKEMTTDMKYFIVGLDQAHIFVLLCQTPLAVFFFYFFFILPVFHSRTPYMAKNDYGHKILYCRPWSGAYFLNEEDNAIFWRFLAFYGIFH